MNPIFPLQCQRCASVTWMNVDFYKNNGGAHLKDLCPHCDSPKFSSLFEIANRSEEWMDRYRAIDFYLARELME